LRFRSAQPSIKDGFIDSHLSREEIGRELLEPEGLVVVMEPLIALAGRVVAPDGRPVPAFTVVADRELPVSSDSIRRDVQDGNGRFSLDLSEAGTTWLGVAATGFAPWEGRVDVKRGVKPLDVRLSPGVSVSTSVVAPDALRSRVKATLVPRRGKSDPVDVRADWAPEDIASRTATRSADGRLRFEHVRPDHYWLVIAGPGVPEKVLGLDVPGTGLDVGTVHIDLSTAFGRIQGRVWHPKDKGGDLWAFADGYVGGFRFQGAELDDHGIAFQADENGRFQVNRVPVGLTTVEFPFQYYDVIDSYTWSALVVEGQTTVLNAFDPEQRRDLTLTFAIGDGSQAQYDSGTGLGAARKVDNVTVSSSLFASVEKAPATPRQPMFRVELVPLSKGPLSFAQPDWHELDPQRRIVLRDVGPGRYRMRVYDWLGWVGFDSGPLFERELVVPPGGGGEVRVALGAGCITGKIPEPPWYFERHVDVTAVAKGSRTASGWARRDDDGNFCVRYLSPGTYSLYIHDAASGFCRVDDVQVPAGVVDIGQRVLSAGATIRGAIQFPQPSRLPDAVVAVGPSGVSVRRAFSNDLSFDHFELAGLWPGIWTISARRGDEVLATKRLNAEGAEAFDVTLAAGNSGKP
jgi:hypothetical protein